MTNLTPGLKSPLYQGSLMLAAGLLLCSTTDYDRTVSALVIACTALLTENSTARGAAIIGGAIRVAGSGTVGFFAQAVGAAAQITAVTYACEEMLAKVLAKVDETQSQTGRPAPRTN